MMIFQSRRENRKIKINSRCIKIGITILWSVLGIFQKKVAMLITVNREKIEGTHSPTTQLKAVTLISIFDAD